jgi:hypothetical protein
MRELLGASAFILDGRVSQMNAGPASGRGERR